MLALPVPFAFASVYFPLAELVAYVYVPTFVEYGVYVKFNVSLPTPVFIVLAYVVAPVHVTLCAVICVLVNSFAVIVTVPLPVTVV